MEIIYNDTLSILKKNNIQQIETINKKMDPNIHQAMMEIEDETKATRNNSSRNTKGIFNERKIIKTFISRCLKKKQN